jgi:hypothetical protein
LLFLVRYVVKFKLYLGSLFLIKRLKLYAVGLMCLIKSLNPFSWGLS